MAWAGSTTNPPVFSWHRFFETAITVCSSPRPHIHNQQKTFNRPALDGQGSQERVSQRNRGKEGKNKNLRDRLRDI